MQQVAGRTCRRIHCDTNSYTLTLLVQGEKEVMHSLLPQELYELSGRKIPFVSLQNEKIIQNRADVPLHMLIKPTVTSLGRKFCALGV